jgi:hypothetical protein
MKLTRRQLAASAVGVVVATPTRGMIAGAKETRLLPLTEEQIAEIKSDPCIGLSVNLARSAFKEYYGQELEPSCPGIGEFLEQQARQVRDAVLKHYPNLTDIIGFFSDPAQIDEERAKRRAEEATEEAKEAHAKADLQTRRDLAAENPPAELIDNAKDFIGQTEQQEFGEQLESARLFWREHRSLVESESMPEPFRSALIRAHGCAEGNLRIDDKCLRPGYEERLPEQARELAADWIRNGVAERNHSFVLPGVVSPASMSA